MRIQEQKRKAAKYEAMIHRFQIRRVDGSVAASRFTSTRLVIDKQLHDGRASWRKRSRRPSLRRLTRQLQSLTIEPSGLFQPLLPEGRAATLHGVVMIAAFYFQVFYLPFAPCFFHGGSNVSTAIDVTLEVLAIVDIAMNFNTAFAVKRGVSVTSRWRIARRYLRTWLLFDAVAAFPLQTMRFVLGGSSSTWHRLIIHNTPMVLMRLVRLNIRGNAHQVSDRLTRWIRYSKYSHLLGIVRLLWLVVVITHYMACFWHLLDDHQGTRDLSIGEQYVANYYYAVTLIHGQGNVSSEWGQNLFSTFVVLAGSVIVATIFGNVAMLVSNFNANATNYQRKMEGVFATMDKMELPDRLRDRIQQYYAHVWAEYESLDGDLVKFQRELTHTLGLEVGLFKYMGLVNDIPFWAECSPDFIAQIVMTLVVRVYLPDDFVVRQGEICSEMFMVNRGVCEMTSHDSDQSGLSFVRTEVDDEVDDEDHWAVAVGSRSRMNSLTNLRIAIPDQVDDAGTSRTPLGMLAMMPPGTAFGEMSLLMNYKQPRSVRATSFVEMCVLERRSFQRILSRHPEDRRRTLTAMVRSCVETNAAPLAWRQTCRAEVLRRDRDAEADASVDAMTPTEVAAMLVELIDVQAPDRSIAFGFQDGSTAVRRGNSPTNSEQAPQSAPECGDALCRLLMDKVDMLAAAVGRIEVEQTQQKPSCSCSKSRSRAPRGRHELQSLTSRSGTTKTPNADYERLRRLFDSQRVQSTPLGSVLPTDVGLPLDSMLPLNSTSLPRRLSALTVELPPSADPDVSPSPTARPSASVAPVMRSRPDRGGLERPTIQEAKTTTFITAPAAADASRRHRASLADAQSGHQLVHRFFSSRMSNPSTERGSAWGIPSTFPRANTQQGTTLADQLYQRRRRRSRNVAAADD
jgi:CRP-like cAMP-binding protein